MNQKDIEQMAEGYPPSTIGKDHEEVVVELANRMLSLQQELDAVLAENVMLKNGIGFFSYGSDSGFEEHDSAEKAIAAADADIDYYRGDAGDGWSEETDQTVWGVIMQRATMTGLRPVNEDDNCAEWAEEWCDYALLPNLLTPATDAILNAVRAEGAASVGSLIRACADEFPDSAEDVLEECAMIADNKAAQLRAETDTTYSQYESLAKDGE